MTLGLCMIHSNACNFEYWTYVSNWLDWYRSGLNLHSDMLT